jgi:hypothetical protein
MSCYAGFTNHRWFASPLARESAKPTPSHVYIAYSSVFPSHPDIIPHLCLLSAACDSLKWALLVVDYCQHHMASALCRTASDSMEHSPLYSVRSNFSFYFNIPWSIYLIPPSLVHIARPIPSNTNIPVMSTYPYFNYSYLLYQYLPILTVHCSSHF